jgi:hypothetical protein
MRAAGEAAALGDRPSYGQKIETAGKTASYPMLA